MIPNYKRPQINDYIFDILERPMTDEDLEIINYLREIEKENQELKKQLEDKEDFIKKLQGTKDRLDKYNYEITMQQQEFIKYLEDEIKACKAVSDLLFTSNKEMKVYKEILQKYKEIIGVSDDY